MRNLGVPTVTDRFVQQAILTALDMMNDGNAWIVDIDLEKFFDTVKLQLVEDITRLSHLDEGAEDMKWDMVKSLAGEAESKGIKVELQGRFRFDRS
jgi:hypothetical protein